MTLKEYFKKTSGRGIISTSDGKGVVNAAVYATPHFLEGGEVAFVMRDRLTHKNIEENPHASYLFTAGASGVEGLRLYLEKTGEERNTSIINRFQRRKRTYTEDQELGPKYLVYFKVNKILPLVGAGDPGVTM